METSGLSGSGSSQQKRILSEPLSSSWKRVRNEYKEDGDDLNGFLLNDILIPETALEVILSYTSASDILKIAQVCTVWKNITTRRSFWKLVFTRAGSKRDWDSIPAHVKENEHAWMVFYAVVKSRFLHKNLVKNPSGHNQFENWEILQSGGDGFVTESPPAGIDDLPPLSRDCEDCSENEGMNDAAFVTSFGWCSKQQKIDLWEAGLTPAVMKTMFPFQLIFSEMVGTRFDCGGIYRIHLCLENDSDKGVTNEVLVEDTRQSGAGWGEVTSALTVDQSLKSKLNQIRYFVVTNHGKDNQFWAGHYGIKFSRVTVTVKCVLPSELPPEKAETDSSATGGSSNSSKPSRYGLPQMYYDYDNDYGYDPIGESGSEHEEDVEHSEFEEDAEEEDEHSEVEEDQPQPTVAGASGKK